MIDTGADVSVITAETARRIGKGILPTKRMFTGADRGVLDVMTNFHLVTS